MAIPPYPLINGVRHSWSSVSIDVAGRTYGGIQEINYSSKLDAGTVYGAGSQPIGTTTGQGSFTCDLTILLEEYNALVATMGPGYMTAYFDIAVTYSDEGFVESGLSTMVDTIKSCRLTEVGAAASNGSTDGLTRKLTVLPLQMFLNGVSPMPNQPSLGGGAIGTAAGVVKRIIGI